MFLKLRPFFYSLMFFCGLEIIARNHSNLNLAAFVLAILLLISLREGKIIGKKWRFSILPIFFTLSSISLLYLVTIKYEQQFFIFLAFGMHYLALFGAYRLGKYAKDQTAKGMNMAASFATIFFAYAGAYGLYLNFFVPLYFLMLAYFLITTLISYQYFSIIKSEELKTVWIYSFLLGLTMAEIIWTMNFWPFGYLTTGVIALILYYMLWDIVQSYFLGLLSRKRVTINAVFFSFLIILLLLTSKWIPVI